MRFPAGRAEDGAPPTLDSTSPGSGPVTARGPHRPARHPTAASLALGDSIRPFQAHHLPIPWRSTSRLWHGVGRGRDASCCAMVTFPSVPPSPSHRIAPPIRPGSRNKKGPSLPSSLSFAMAVATVHGRSATSAERGTVNTDRDGRQTDPTDPCRIHRVVRTDEKRSDVLDETRFLPTASVHARVSTTRIRPCRTSVLVSTADVCTCSSVLLPNATILLLSSLSSRRKRLETKRATGGAHEGRISGSATCPSGTVPATLRSASGILLAIDARRWTASARSSTRAPRRRC